MFKKSHILLSFLAVIFLSLFCFDFINAKDETTITTKQANVFIDNILDKNFHWLDQKHQQLKFLNALENRILSLKTQNKNISVYLQAIQSHKKILEEQLQWVQKILVWYSQNHREIYGYYKWDIDKDFLLITANSHGWYEYGTYLTALDLIQYFEEKDKNQWFIIPTLNPDGLQIAIDDNFQQGFYLEWRSNSNNVDINRNFCTKNFSSWKYLKSFGGENKLIWKWEKCWDQLETQIIDTIFDTFSFSQVLDFHSLGAILFIPDNGFDDPRVVEFAQKTQELFWNHYDFNAKFTTQFQKNIAIQRYEFDEWGKNIYTWFLAQYIYETYNIPAIVVEFEYHWRVEKQARNLENLLK